MYPPDPQRLLLLAIAVAAGLVAGSSAAQEGADSSQNPACARVRVAPSERVEAEPGQLLTFHLKNRSSTSLCRWPHRLRIEGISFAFDAIELVAIRPINDRESAIDVRVTDDALPRDCFLIEARVEWLRPLDPDWVLAGRSDSWVHFDVADARRHDDGEVEESKSSRPRYCPELPVKNRYRPGSSGP